MRLHSKSFRLLTPFLMAAITLGIASSVSANSSRAGLPDHAFPDHRFPELPGISLASLVDGDSFTSRNGKLTFSEFSVDTSGIAPENLDYYRVFRLGDGFKLFTPLFGFGGHDAGLSLMYKVEADDGLLISGAHLSIQGATFLGKTRTEMDIFDYAGGDDPLAELAVYKSSFLNWPKHGSGKHGSGDAIHDRGHKSFDMSKSGGWHGSDPKWTPHSWFGKKSKTHDSARLSEAVSEILVKESTRIKTGLFAKNWSISHHFKTKPIPEPTTALLLGLGLAGMAYTSRRRRVR